MAQVYQFELAKVNTQAEVTAIGNSILFADLITPRLGRNEANNANANLLVVTSNVDIDQSALTATDFEILADDSQSELSIDISTGKFVEGNLICGYAPLTMVQTDVRDFVAYKEQGSDNVWFKGVCSTTQSQDYTPDLVSGNKPIHMLTPAQVASINF
jgi:uncharacterized secreted protein with C-terminal beta-propeller domain